MPNSQLSVDILAKALVNLRRHPFEGKLDGVSASMFDGLARQGPFSYKLLAANKWLFGGLIEKQLAANRRTDAMLRTSTAPTMLNAGTKSNVMPKFAKATVNFRIHPRDSIQRVVDHVKKAINDQRVTVRLNPGGSGVEPSPVSSADSEGFRLISSGGTASVWQCHCRAGDDLGWHRFKALRQSGG